MTLTNSWLTIDFWHDILRQSLHWLFTSGPIILMILILGLIAFRLSALFLKRFKEWLGRHETGIRSTTT